MTTSQKPVTGYQVCQEQVEIIRTEQAALRAAQRGRDLGVSLAGPVRALSQSAALLQAEIRKTGDDARRAVENLPPDKQALLIIQLINELSPEYRVAIQVHLDDLGGKLL